MAQQEFCGKIPSPHPGLHDTIPSRKDTSKLVQSSGLSRGQGKDTCPNMRPRSYRKIRQKASIKKNWLSQGIKHGLTKPTLQTPLYSPCSQSPPRPDILATAATTGRPHPKAKICTLSLLPGRPDTIPSGKDTGTLARSSGQCRGVSTDCKSWQARSCNCRPFILHKGARCTHGPKHGHRNRKQTSKADPCVRLI